ncbi:MAG: helix-turn-helix domain-containing protein [Actinomycetota bacterium]
MANQSADDSTLLDVAGAAAYLQVSEAFIRRLVLERRLRYYKLGKFVRFRPVDLDAFVESGRQDPVQPWAQFRSASRTGATRRGTSGRAGLTTKVSSARKR